MNTLEIAENRCRTRLSPSSFDKLRRLRTGFVEAPETDPAEENVRQMVANACRDAPPPDAAGCRVIVLPVGAAGPGAKARTQPQVQGDDANSG